MRITLPSISALVLTAGALTLGDAAPAAEPPARLRATGVIFPYQEVDVAAASDGVIVETPVEEGQEVHEEQVLARMRDNREAAEVEYYKKLVEVRAADIAPSKKLFNEGVLSKEKWDEKLLELKSAETSLRMAEEKLAEKTIKAPLSGIVLRRYKERGESIKNLETFITIVSVDKLYVTAYFDGQHISRVQRGQKAQVTIASQENTVCEGAVEIIDPVIDRASGLFRVKICVENADRKIRSGATCTVELKEAPPQPAPKAKN